MIAGPCNHGQRDGSFCWATLRTRCFRISARGPTRRSKTASPWGFFLRDRSRPKCPPRCLNTKKLRRVRTDFIQAEARKNGLRFDSKYESLEQRDREIANSAAFRKSLYDYDVEDAAIACRSKRRCPK